MNALVEMLGAIAGLRVVVVGEAMLDAYLHGSVERLCREAPVPVLAVEWRTESAGGAGNAAANIAALGGRAELVTVVGTDRAGQRVVELLGEAGVGTSGILRDPTRGTLTKERLVAADQLLLRVDGGTGGSLGAALEDALLRRLDPLLGQADALVISDYAYGLLGDRVLSAVAEMLARRPVPLVVDARDPRRYRRLQPTAVKPNYGEAMRLLGEPEQREPRQRAAQVGSNGERLLSLTGARIAAVTVDQDGAFVFERGAPPYRTYARPRAHSRAAGAGDTFVAALALGLAAGAPAPLATELASAASAVVVGKDGTATCSADEIRAWLEGSSKRLDMTNVDERIAELRRSGRRVVFTNGCFDILHRGHITYLNRAKGLGDVLIVGVNSDAGVRRLKGSGRPVNPLDDRLHVLEALSCVDHVIAFDDDTPEGVIEHVAPDVFVKGGDYQREDLPEGDLVERLGGSVRILPYVQDRSTTRIIARVREDAAPGAA
jgi:D-beta-D-heptose 7-phosphate kinase / D-beta-D-heptose 1-phosphate adenosyltransferase